MSQGTPNAYLRTKIMTASPAELRLMLFDGAIRFAEQARAGLEAKDYEKTYNGATRCQNIVLELISSLRPEENAELCEKLSALYTFIYSRIVSATMQRDVDLLDEALHLLRYERETWALVLEQLSGENRAAAGQQTTPSATPADAAGRSPAADAPASSAAARNPAGGQISLQG